MNNISLKNRKVFRVKSSFCVFYTLVKSLISKQKAKYHVIEPSMHGSIPEEPDTVPTEYSDVSRLPVMQRLNC